MKVRDLIFPEGVPHRKSKKPVRVLGIDLGTTNSTVSEVVYDPASKSDISVRCLAVEQPTGSRSHWNPLVPSVVAIYEGQMVVGEGARLLRSKGREAGLIEESNIQKPHGTSQNLQHGSNRLPISGRSQRAYPGISQRCCNERQGTGRGSHDGNSAGIVSSRPAG